MDDTRDLQWHNGAPWKLANVHKTLSDQLTASRECDAELVRNYYAEPLEGAAGLASLDLTLLAERAVNAMDQNRRFNLLAAAIEAFQAMVCSSPAVDVTTTGGGYKQRKSAEALQQWCGGVFTENDLEATEAHCVVDMCLTRVAAVRLDITEDDSLSIDRVIPHWLVWNPKEGKKPRNLFLASPVPRASLLEKYADDSAKVAAIKVAPDYKPDPMFQGLDGFGQDSTREMVLLIEGFRTARSKKDPGCYVACLEGATTETNVLDVDQDWPHKFHVIVPLRFAPTHTTFAGKPAGERLQYYQDELDEIAESLKEGFVKGAQGWVGVPTPGSGIKEDEITNKGWAIVHHAPGMAPEFHQGKAPPAEYIQREQTIIDRAFNFLGMSYSVASGKKADGVTSAKGQREVKALADNRQIVHMRKLDRWREQIARTAIALADWHYKTNKSSIVVHAPGSDVLRQISWQDIDYDKDKFTVSVDSVNALARHPSARVEEILSLVQGGIIDQRQALKNLGVKDLKHVKDRAFAMDNLAERLIDLALSGDYHAPEPYMGRRGLQLLIDRAREQYCIEMVQDEPSENLDQLRKLIEHATDEMNRLPPEPGSQPAAPPGLPAPNGVPSLAAPPPEAAPNIMQPLEVAPLPAGIT